MLKVFFIIPFLVKFLFFEGNICVSCLKSEMFVIITTLVPQQGGFHHVGHKQSLRTSLNTSGPTVCDPTWLFQRQWHHTFPAHCYSNGRRQTAQQSERALGVLYRLHKESPTTHRYPKNSQEQWHKGKASRQTPHTHTGSDGICQTNDCCMISRGGRWATQDTNTHKCPHPDHPKQAQAPKNTRTQKGSRHFTPECVIFY